MRLLPVLIALAACSHATSAAHPTVTSAATAAGDAASSEEGPCGSDADCSLTLVDKGACCPLLCQPRAVTRSRAQELESRQPSCNGGRPCPAVSCHPLPRTVLPACEQNRCVVRLLPAGAEQ